MKPTLEVISKPIEKQSFQCFTVSKPSFDPFWHYHPEIELTYITKGEGTRFVGNHISQYREGDLVLIGKNLPHHWVSMKEQGSPLQEGIVIQFLQEILIKHNEFIEVTKLLNKSKNGLFFPSPSSAVKQSLQELPYLKGPLQLLKLLSILSLLTKEEYVVLSTEEYQFTNKNQRQLERVDRVSRFILENFQRNISLEEVSDIAHMTPPSFCRWFKKNLGNTFTTFLNATRVEAACQYLITTRLPINEIALKVGFDNVIYFNRTFKSLKGITPKQIRLQTKKGA
ncbi:MAG: bacillibactin transport regulator [Flavobacteriaceae bacterium]|nr:bacillibactin transport regulator [Flavobacteriaceae bacterium]